MRVRAAKVAITIWAMGIGSGLAVAGNADDAAEKLIRHGIELRRGRDDEAAAREFHKAYKLVPTPRAAAQLGLAKQALGLWEEAETYVGEALRAVGQDSWVTKNRSTLDEALGNIQTHLGRIEVIGDPEGADVSMNGRRVGKLPLAEPVRVSAGAVDIDMRASGYKSAQRTVTLVGGQYQHVVIHLAKVEPPKAEPTNPPAIKAQAANPGLVDVDAGTPPAEKGPEPAGTATRRRLDAADGGPSATRIALKWTAAGLAVGGLVTGVVGTAKHTSDEAQFNNHPCRNKNGVGVQPDGTTDQGCQSLLNTLRTDQKIAIVGFVAAGALAATWLVLLLTEPSPARPVDMAARRAFCAPGLMGVGLSCVARF